jgi:cytochrome c-type biogenesis protein CcmH/NrfG
LNLAPGCVPVRRLQRAALVKRAETKNKLLSKAMGSVTMAGFMFASKKDPLKALESADKMLHADPSNIGALKSLGEASKSLGMMETAAFAWEAIRELQPKDHDTLVSLANAYIDARMHKEAVRVAEDLLKLRPSDGDALALMRKASVAQTMDKGKWESQSSFRTKLKDENLAVSLEQAAKVVTSAEMSERLIEEAKDRLAQQPDNINHYRTIIEGYRRIDDSASALEYVKKARLLPAAAGDAAFEKLQGDLTIAVLEKQAKALAQQSAAAPDDAALKQAAATAAEELAKAKLDDARLYVER